MFLQFFDVLYYTKVRDTTFVIETKAAAKLQASLKNQGYLKKAPLFKPNVQILFESVHVLCPFAYEK